MVSFSRIYLKINVRPKLCMPSQEAQRTSPFKTYLPNLTAFKNSRRRWITCLILKGLSKDKCAAQTMYALTRSPTNRIPQNLCSLTQAYRMLNPTDTTHQKLYAKVRIEHFTCKQIGTNVTTELIQFNIEQQRKQDPGKHRNCYCYFYCYCYCMPLLLACMYIRVSR